MITKSDNPTLYC